MCRKKRFYGKVDFSNLQNLLVAVVALNAQVNIAACNSNAGYSV